jgi:Flp pilus assembly protein TadG
VRVAAQERAATAVEFALILPILLTILFAIIQFGLTLNNQIQLTDSIREGARSFAINRASGTPFSSAETTITNAAPSLVPLTNINPQFSVNGSSCTSDTTCTALMASGYYATVSGTYACNLTVLGVNFLPGGCTLSASTTDLVE